MTTEHACWVTGAADPRADFPIDNLPWGVAERPDRPGEPRIVAAIGDHALDCAEAAGFGMLEGLAPRIVAALRQPTLNAFMALGAAVTVSLRRGGLIAPVLILPLCVPVLIFGVGAIAGLGSDQAMVFLGAISLVTCAFSPLFAALALRTAED